MKNGKNPLAVILGIFSILLIIAAPRPVHAQMDDSGIAKAFKWRNIGPANMSGRVADIEALDKDFTTVLIGSASGGVWKSVNAGTSWEPIFDTYGAASIGDVAFYQANPDIIWVGTGEKNTRNSIAWGDGIYKSVDGGKTWTSIRSNLPDGQVAYVIREDHKNKSLLFLGTEFGLFISTDGGKTWDRFMNKESVASPAYLFDQRIATEWEERREIGNQLRESLEKRGLKFAGINRRTQKLNPIPAVPGVYKVTLTVNGKSLTKSLTVRTDPMFD